MKKKGLRVLTYNIHKGFNMSNRRFILHQIREALIAADADLLFLQEMQGRHQRHEKKVKDWPDQSQLEFIAEGVWPFFAYGKNAIYNAGHHGNAILSNTVSKAGKISMYPHFPGPAAVFCMALSVCLRAARMCISFAFILA